MIGRQRRTARPQPGGRQRGVRAPRMVAWSTSVLVSLLLLGVARAVSAQGERRDEPPTWRPFEHPARAERTVRGFTRPRRVLELASEVTGRVIEVLLDEGEIVSGAAGDWVPVARLDRSLVDRDRELARAELALRAREVRVNSLRVRRAERLAADRQRGLARTAALFARGRASEEDRDDAQLAHEVALLDVEMARAELAERQAQEERSRVAAARIETLRTRYELKAPAGWRLEVRRVEPGSIAAAGEPLLRFVHLARLRVPLRLSEEEIRAVRHAAPLVLFALPERLRVPARLLHIGAEFDPRLRKRQVELEIDGVDWSAVGRPASGGLEVELALQVELADGAIVVPSQFIARRLEQFVVHTADGGIHVITPIREQAGKYVILPGTLPRTSTLVLPPGSGS